METILISLVVGFVVMLADNAHKAHTKRKAGFKNAAKIIALRKMKQANALQVDIWQGTSADFDISTGA